MKPYYERDGTTLIHGDCLQVLPTMEAGSVGLVLTDPPWGVNNNNANKSRFRGKRPYDPQQEAKDFLPVAGDNEEFNPLPLLKFKNLILWGANHFAHLLPKSHFWLNWDRKNNKAADSDITDCELAWTRGTNYRTVRTFRHMWAGFQRDSQAGEKHLHPMEKPVALMEWCIGFFPKAELILDPYAGSGPTLLAAWRLGRRAVGIEISEEYAEIAAKRIDAEISRGRLFAPEPEPVEQATMDFSE